jgi:hypothetical protein
VATTRYVLNITGGQTTVWDDASSLYAGLTNGRVSTSVMPVQTAITDLNLGTLVLLTDAITAIGTIQTKLNTLLSELRTAGLISP